MIPISFDNLTVQGVPYKKILSIFITHSPNNHGWAKIVGQIDTDKAEDFLHRIDETFGVEITTSAEGQPQHLFYGILSNTTLEKQAEFAILTIELKTSSCLLDSKKTKRTFQNTTKTYSQILNDLDTVKRSGANIQIMVSDKAIGKLIMQYKETDWEFIIRMASQLGAPVFVDIISREPQIYVGLPPAKQTKEISTISYNYDKDESAYQSMSSNTPAASSSLRDDFASEIVHSYACAYLGDVIAFNGKSEHVRSVSAQLIDGLLEFTYSVSLQNSFIAPQVLNKQASGRILTGKVKAVKADRVQVFLYTVDSDYDSSGNWWFPYSTAYSSQDGSGWYSMPAVDDEVRVFFPSDNEGEAFAASSVTKNVRPDVTDKCWRGVNGKQILMTKEGLIIICKEGKLFINLTDEKGIEIISDLDINITSATKVNIQASDEIKIVAKNQVIVGTNQSYLDLRNDGVILTGEKILIT